MKAQMSVDRRLFTLLGKKLYEMNPVVIAVREVEQNSRDACIRAGVEPDIHIGIEYFESEDKVVLMCSDNGCGMDEETIVSKFLCLGGTGKTGTKETGRFGVAKVALMCGTYWYVHTLDNELDSQTVDDEAEIAKTTYRDGTLIQIEYRDVGSSYSWLEKSVMMMAFSGTLVHFTYRKNGELIYDEILGNPANLVEMKHMERWDSYGIEEVVACGFVFRGNCIVRLNGLVQHIRYRSWRETMKVNLLVDLNSDLDPDDPKFPMVMSREKLVGTVEQEVSEWHSFNSENPASTDEIVRRKITTPTTKFTAGHLYTGKRDPSGMMEERFNEISERDEHKADAIREWLGAAGNQAADVGESGLGEFFDQNSKNPLLRMYDYEVNPDDVYRDVNFVIAWARILENLLTTGTTFGVGLMGGHFAAEISMVEGVPFFCINPKIFPIQPSLEAQVLCIWTAAIEEAAHMAEDGHNQRLVSVMAYLTSVSANAILQDMKNLTKLLKET